MAIRAEEKPGGAVGDGGTVPDPETDVVAYLQYVQARVQPLTRSAAQLPGPSDMAFHRSMDRSLGRDLDATKTSVLEAVRQIIACVSETQEEGEITLEDLLDAGKFERRLGDVVDTLLERTDMRLDEYSGKAPIRDDRKSANGRTTNLTTSTNILTNGGPLPPQILNAPIKPLPQAMFSKKPDNSREQRWTHSLVDKPHAGKFDDQEASTSVLDKSGFQGGVRRGMYCAEGDPRENPYYREIVGFVPPQYAFDVPEMQDLQAPPPLEKDEPDGGPIPFQWVNDQATFDQLYEHLMEDRMREVAIDVEHHNFRSYQGLVCLVQISTRWKDFIVDALSPTIRDVAFRLNDVFADPSKVKVLHGAEHDVLWLQRDLSLYVVGLFDTFHAANVLQFPQRGLAYLLQRYINFVADKRYQLADWRIRPLPKEMLYYARSDTHSLLHVYDCMRFEIEQQQRRTGIETVFEQSKKTAAKTYAKEIWDDDTASREGWRAMWQKLGGEEAVTTDVRFEKYGVDGLTLTERLFRALHDWRDRVARKEDESPRYILNSANLLNLSSRAPQTRESVQACVGTALKKRVGELLKLIVAEVKTFEEVQEQKAVRQRELIEQGIEVNEEMGELVERASAPTSNLFPSQTVDEPNAVPRSSLASLLFAQQALSERKSQPGTEKKRSLFTPISKASSDETLLQSIRSDFVGALSSILGSDVSTSAPSVQPNEEVASLDSTKTSVSAETPTVGAVEPATIRASVSEKAEAVSDTSLNDGLVRVKKRKEKKSEKESEKETNEGNEEQVKKRRWSKEEKAERKRNERERLAAVEPFDYSTAKSVLDVQPERRETKSNDRRERSKAAPRTDEGKGKGKKGETQSPRSGRYANVPATRDRREQAGGKSMTFSR